MATVRVQPKPGLFIFTVAMLCMALPVTVQAQFQCPTPAFRYDPGAAVIEGFDAESPEVQAQADRVQSADGVITLDGNTIIGYQGRQLLAENAKYNPDTGEVAVDGKAEFTTQGVRVESRDAAFDLDDNLFSTGPSTYNIDIEGRRARGASDALSRQEDGVLRLDGATYTTCPAGDNGWMLRASNMQLFPDAGIGTATGLVLRFKNVPLLAVPYFSFPISPERKTGFLAPVIARSDNTGLELRMPWYWNIRPNLDATFTPRFMSKRGTQLQSQFRYLNTQGIWVFENEYLRDTSLDGLSRTFTQLSYQGEFGPWVDSSISAAHVSDKDYFDDLGDSLQLASITHLEQLAELRYARGPLSGAARLQSYQTVDRLIAAEDRPYRRLPQFTLGYRPEPWRYGFRASTDAELVYFDRSDSITGLRLDVQPRLSWPVERDAWFFRPTIANRFTWYDLNNVKAEKDERSRNLAIFAIDSGLFFDRVLDDTGSLQTLEPRLYYLRIPYEDQSGLPLFDTNALDFSISQLFRENRFSGADRVADANQLSAAVTSRFIDGTDGREILRGSVGQIVYFDDRRVLLEEEAAGTRGSSDLVGEVSSELLRNWLVRGSIQHNRDATRTIRSAIQLSYRPSADRIVNLAHRNVNTNDRVATEQLDFSALWPINDQWRLAGRWNFSLDGKTSLETLLGLEYDSCCWALRLAARRYIADDGQDHENSFYLQLVLKGLAPLGQNYGALLESAILGYQDEYDR